MDKNITCVIITLNEEDNIAECISSARQVCDEIVVVDAESTDNTVSIASANGAVIISKPWTGFADARSAGAEAATHDWILSLDADERLSPELVESISQHNLDKNIVYKLDILTYFADTPVYHSGWPVKNDRLYNRTTARWDGNFVHEKIIPSSLKRKTLKGKVHHYSYISVEDHNQRMDKYARLGAEKMFRQGKHYSAPLKHIKAIFRYFRTLVLKHGILDGKLGFFIAKQNYRLIIKRFNYLREMEKSRDRENK